MKTIDADAIVLDYSGLAYINPYDFKEVAKYFANQIKQMPSIEPGYEIGQWIYSEHDIAMCDGYRCSKCDFFVPWDYQHKFIDYIKDYHYCPHCGAKMEI